MEACKANCTKYTFTRWRLFKGPNKKKNWGKQSYT